MEAGRLDDVEALCIRNSGGCITQSRSRVARFMISAVYRLYHRKRPYRLFKILGTDVL